MLSLQPFQNNFVEQHLAQACLTATTHRGNSSNRSAARSSTAAGACAFLLLQQCRGTSHTAASTVVTGTGTGTGTGMKQTGTAADTTSILTTTATEERAGAGRAHVMAVTGKACIFQYTHAHVQPQASQPLVLVCCARCRDHRSSGRDGRSSQGTTPTKPPGSGPPAAGGPPPAAGAAAGGAKQPAVGRGLLGSR
jgi:hypothetical protein